MSSSGPSSSDLNADKVGALFVFLATSFLGVWVPYFIPVRAELLKLGLLFSSGLFLSLAFLHLSHDCVELFEEKYSGEYPLAFLVIVSGFYLTWFADLVANAVWKKRASRLETSPEQAEEKPARVQSLSCCKLSQEASVQQTMQPALPAEVCGRPDCDCPGPGDCSCSPAPCSREEEEGAVVVIHDIDHNSSATSSSGGTETNEAGAGDHAAESVGNKLSLLDVVLLLLALCFHAIFEGLAVGLASSAYNVWNLTLSICLNEFFEGLALGSTLRAQDVKRSFWVYLLYALGASVVAPTGIVIGIVLDTTVTPAAADWAQGIGNGLAAGVFVCIATRHLIAKAMVPSSGAEAVWMPFLKFGVSFLGLATNALTTLRED